MGATRSADFIVVGGGSAGCVLANRLSADPANTVALLEAGGWDKSLFIHMPAGYLHLMKTGMVDWGYHSTPQKHLNNRVLYSMREGIKIGREIIAQKAFDPFRGKEYAPGEGARSDAAIEDYVRNYVDSNYHLVGTCRMGIGADAVVDDRLRVRGIDGLRVIDASVMPTVVSGNTNAATIMIAEKGADFVLGSSLPPAVTESRTSAIQASAST